MVKLTLITMSALVVVTALGCGSGNDPSPTGSQPDVGVDLIAQGDAQREVNAYSPELCGFEVF